MIDLFRSARLMYRAVSLEKDLPLFQSIHADTLGYENSNPSNIHLPTTEDAREFMKAVSEALLGAIICLPPPDSSSASRPIAIGQIHLKTPGKYQSHHRNSEVAIQILPKWQGRGYGSEAINWVLDLAFRRAGLHRVRVRAFGWNGGAIRLYERLGFRVEGREREALWHDGKWWDDVLFGILEGEWWERERGG